MKHLITALAAVLLLALGGLFTVSATQSSATTSAATKAAGQRPSESPAKDKAQPKRTPAPTPSSTPVAAAETSPAAAAPAPATQAPAPAAPAPAPAPAIVPAAASGSGSSAYPLHSNIISTTFWVGEIFNASLSDGSQVCSTYNSQWAYQHTGVKLGTVDAGAAGCPGSYYGGCDGVSSGSGADFKCATERRVASNGYFPLNQPKPLQNPFYLDLPYDDLNDGVAFQERCRVIPWAAADNAATGADHCADQGYSYMKNRWVQITGPNGSTCYGQIEDAGPSSGSEYHDSAYVFGAGDARPVNQSFSADATQGAGMDVSPALNGCLGFAELDGSSDRVSWRFIDRANVPAGPWLTVETTSGVSN